MNVTNQKMSTDDIEALLPWYAAGTLDARDAVIVDGPHPGGSGGMYRVRVARNYVGKDELERLVKEFQSASNLVSMAVPTE